MRNPQPIINLPRHPHSNPKTMSQPFACGLFSIDTCPIHYTLD